MEVSHHATDGEARHPARIADHLTHATVPQTLPPEEYFSPLAADAFVVVVATPAGRHLRRAFLSMSGAEKAYHRAIASGQPASMILCRITPVLPWTGQVGAE
jgi:hypothetical protein